MKKDIAENFIAVSHFSATNAFALLSTNEKTTIKDSVAKLLLTFVVGVNKIDPHLDNDNQSIDKYFPCFPMDFGSMSWHEIMAFIQKHLPRLRLEFSRKDFGSSPR